MSLKQNKCYKNTKKLRKICQIVDKYEMPTNGNRVVLPCSEDVDLLATESCRNRLISQIINREELAPREFTSYFNGPARNTEPPYSLTSHKSTTPITPKQKPAMSIFPSLVQGLRWNPYVETTTVSQTEVVDNQKFMCRCVNCNSLTCPGKTSFSRIPKRANFPKDNIVTYTNQYTMTKMLNDASCGGNVTIMPSPCVPETNDVAITVSEVAVRDPGRVCTPLPKCQPAPILKRMDYDNCNDYRKFETWQRQMQYDRTQEAERDIDGGEFCYEPPKTRFVKCFPKEKRKKSCGHTVHTYPPCDRNRKILYNEGISDTIASSCSPTQCYYPESINSECGQASFRWTPCNFDINEGIPHSHRKSKYHHDCKKSDPSAIKHKHCELRPPEMKPLLNCPTIVRKAYTKRQTHCKSPCINLPRKMLSSEKDIEAFIKTGKFDT